MATSSRRRRGARSGPEPVRAAVEAFRDLATSLDLLDQVAAAQLGIARSDLRCLDVLSRRGEASPTVLAKAVGLSAPALSAALRRLETKGYIDRAHDDADRRSVRVTLTTAAADAVAPLFAQVRAAATAIMQGLDPADLDTLTDTAVTLAQAIEAIAATPPGPRVSPAKTTRRADRVLGAG